MTSRREFLQAGLTATLPFAAAVSLAAQECTAVRAEPSLPLHKVLYEIGCPASVAFARQAARHGAVVQAIEGDVTALWYDDLYHRWRDGAAAVAGLTRPGALFCLEQLAWDHRLRVVLRGRHRCAPEGVRHSLEGPSAVLHAAAGALAHAAWAESMADVVTCWPRATAPAASISAFTPAPPSSIVAEELCSWVIAPSAAPEFDR